jgi:hypothetical protein
MRNVNASDPLLNAQHVAGCYEDRKGMKIKIFESCGLKYLWRFISTQKYIQDYKDKHPQYMCLKFQI